MFQLKNRNGQGLVEYLLLTALLGVATMGIVRLMGHSISGKFTQITEAIQGGKQPKVNFDSVNTSLYQQKDMSTFMENANMNHK